MSRPARNKLRQRQPFLEKGLTAFVLGAGFFLMSQFLSSHPLLSAVGQAVLAPAWVAMGLGVLLVGVHLVMKKISGGAKSDGPRVGLSIQRNGTPSTASSGRETTQPAASTASSAASGVATEWSLAVFQAIEWRRFEAVCEALFAQAGFETRSQSHGADGGVDIWLHSKNAQGPVSVVQCKHWLAKGVGVKEVREFFGVMASHQLKRGTYATTSRFTSDAKEFARRNGIHLLDGTGLLKLIAQRTPEQQQSLLAVAYEGDYSRPTCASCGLKMVERKPAKGGAPFWGCTRFPRCRSTLPMSRTG